MKVIAGDHIEAMLEELRNLTCFPNPTGRTFRQVIDAHTVDMPDVVERSRITCSTGRCRIPLWKPEDSNDTNMG